MPTVNPIILRWARETARLSHEEAAEKLHIGTANGVSGADRLREMEETGIVRQTVLDKMVQVYRRALLTFYLDAPPPPGDRGQDFRSLPEVDTTAEPLVDALVRDIRVRQELVRGVIEDEEEGAQPLAWVASSQRSEGVGAVLAKMRQTIRLDLTEFRAAFDANAAFALLRRRVEEAGVFVLLIGNLGNHHTNIPVEAFRGFALSDPLAPFIVINDQDAKTAWSFTLLHELAHLFLGQTGISGGGAAPPGVEQFCNDVAATFLLPSGELEHLASSAGHDDADLVDRVSAFAEERNLSASMVAYRLFRAGHIDELIWLELRRTYLSRWVNARADARLERQAREEGGGPDYYKVRRHRLGSALLSFAARHVNDGALTPTKAGKVLGVQARNVAPLLSGAA